MKSKRRPSPARTRLLIAKILSAALKRKQASRPEYSRRALARDLGVSPAFVTNMLGGKKSPPPNRLVELARLLELDIHERRRLLGIATPAALASDAPESILGDRQILDAPNTHLLSQWYNLALLEGIGLEAPLRTLASLKTRLRLTQAQLDEALQCLKDAGVINAEGSEDAEPVKRDRHLYIPSGRSKREIRAFHDQMILKARSELLSKTSDADFHRRLITGFTLSVHQRDVEKLKARIVEFLDSLSREAALIPGTDVYQFNIQFFPLTEPVKN